MKGENRPESINAVKPKFLRNQFLRTQSPGLDSGRVLRNRPGVSFVKGKLAESLKDEVICLPPKS